jgi:hypothetical protein
VARRLTILLALGLLLASLAGLASWAASEAVEIRGAFAVAAFDGRVLVGAGREVVLTDERGATLGTLAWRFEDVSSVSFARDGSPLVCDAGRRQLVRFQPDGTGGRVIPLDDAPRLTFEAVDLGDGYFIADTMRHEVRVTDARGATLRKRQVRYPNAAELESTAPLRVALVSTGAAKAFLYDVATLEVVPSPVFAALRDARARGTARRELFELAVLPDGRLIGADCRDTLGECTIVRVGEGSLERIADTLPFVAPQPETTEGLLGVGELAIASDGALLVASPRLGVVLRFENPADGFCQRCDASELPEQGDVWKLQAAPLLWANGTRVSIFGDAALQARFAAIRDARASVAQLERLGRYGAMGLGTLLLLGLFLSRQAGAAESAQSRLNRVWNEIARPNLRAYGVAAGIVALALALGTAAGVVLSGPGVGFAVGAVCAFLASRLVAAPLLARRLDAATARRAWKLHSPLAAGEPLCWVAFAVPRRGVAALAAQAREASGADDTVDLLESLTPRLTLLARTDQRLVAVKTSMLGAPQEPMLSVDLETGLETPPSSLELQTVRFARTWRLPSSTGPGVQAFGEAARWLCQTCQQSYGSCAHREAALAGPIGLSLLLPGLGHLVTGDLGKARALLLVATGLLLQAVGTWLPQFVGTLPEAPWQWQQSVVAYLLTGFVAAAGLALRGWKDRVRAEISQPNNPNPLP